MKGLLLVLSVMVAPVVVDAALAAPSLDGITIIEFRGNSGHEAIARGDHIVVFVSGRGTYAAVTGIGGAGSRSCIATAAPGSYTGDAISFGISGSEKARKSGRDTLCPTFSLHLQDAQTVRVSTPGGYSRAHAIVARVPLVAMDFGAAHFQRHAVRDVRIGPVADAADVGPTIGKPGQNRLVYKGFRRDLGVEAKRPASVQGRAAPAEITGWPWDVLYWAKYYRQYDQPVSAEALRETVLAQYGPPSSESADRVHWIWLYDLDGNLVRPGAKGNACAATAVHWLSIMPDGTVSGLRPEANMKDLGPWGCSLIMELNARSGSSTGNTSSYSVFMGSGYALALSQFFQRIEEPPRLMETLQTGLDYTPTLE